MSRRPDAAAWGAFAGAAAFILLSWAFAEGHLVALDVTADRTLRQPFGTWIVEGGEKTHYVVVDGAPNATEPSRDDVSVSSGDPYGPGDNQTCERVTTMSWRPPPRHVPCDGNFTVTASSFTFFREADWSGYASYLGSQSAATAMIVATALLLAALGQWRTLALAMALAILGGALVDPLKDAFHDIGHEHYDGFDLPALYPSGHTIGATLQFGLFLLLGARALARAGIATPWADRLPRLAVGAWAAISVAVGLDRVVVGSHILSDVLAGWAFGACLVCAAVLLDRRWHSSLVPAPAVAT